MPPSNDTSPSNWFYSQNRQKVGPISRTQLEELARSGSLKPGDMVLPEGQGKWREAGSVDGLFTIPENGAPPAAPGLTATVAIPVEPIQSAVSETANQASQAPSHAVWQSLPPAPSSPTQPLEPSEPAPPTVPGYEILGVLGRGGMGVVYRARHQQLKRIVALKMVLAGSHAGADELARFRTEAEAVASLQHPNIVQIYEVSEQNGLPYCALEFVEGGSLAQKLAGMPQPARFAAGMMQTLARAMHAAHQRGIIHRDLKPANILLQKNPESRTQNPEAPAIPKITDFGLAKKLDDDTGQTRTGAVMGTPSYMSPEQAQGKIRELGPATDIYALGAMLYEMLTGRPPFRGESPMDTLLLAMSEEPLPPSRLHHKVPRDLETICLKCLEKDPTKRYLTAEELADDLQRYLEDRPILARPLNIKERTIKWARRRPAIAGLLLLVALTSFIGFVGIMWNWRKAVVARRDAEVARHDAEQQTEKTRLALAEAERTLYYNRIALAHREYQFRHVGRAQELIDECPERLRDWEWRYLKRLLHTPVKTLTAHTEQVLDVAYSPTGRHFASGSADNTVRIWDAASAEELHVLRGHTDTVWRIAFNNDGTRLASAGFDGVVKIWDVASGESKLTLRVPGKQVHDVAFSPDGQRLAAAAGEVLVWEVKTGNQLLTIPGSKPNFHSLAFSPDGTRLAMVRHTGPMEIWDFMANQIVQRLAVSDRTVYSVAYSPDGKYIATGSSENNIRLWKSDTGQLYRTIRGQVEVVSRLAFSRDSTMLASASSDQTVQLVDFNDEELISLRGHTASVMGVALSPDAKTLISGSGDNTIKIWRTNTDPECQRVRVGEFGGLAISPDSSTVAAIGNTGVKILDVRTGAVRTLQNRGKDIGWASAAAFSSDGKQLALSIYETSYNVTLIDLQRNEALRVLRGVDRQVISALTVSPDGSYCAAASTEYEEKIDSLKPGMATVWDLQSGKRLHTFKSREGGVFAIAFAPNSKLLASAGRDGAITLWDIGTGEEVRSMRGHEHFVTALAFSHDGTLLASGSDDRTIKIWETDSGKLVRTIRGHTGGIHSVSFSPDDRRLVSASIDKTLKLWDTKTGYDILTLIRHGAEVSGAAFSGDGRFIASVGRDKKVRIWDAPP